MNAEPVDLRRLTHRGREEAAPSPLVAVSAVVADLEQRAALAPSTVDSMVRTILRFGVFCEQGLGLPALKEVTEHDVEEFVAARLPDGSPPANNTSHARLSAVKSFFRMAWSLGLADVDPTYGIKLPPRFGTLARPLTDDEIVLARLWAEDVRPAGQRAAIWALAEAGGHQGEISRVEVADLDLDAGTVFFKSNHRADARRGPLTPWGVEQVADYLRRTDPGRVGPLLLIPSLDGQSRASVVGMALINVLRKSGLRGPDIRPRSIVAWGGVKVFEATERIEDVALALGIRSLDAAARLIDYDWAYQHE